jgi:hypothetical protein
MKEKFSFKLWFIAEMAVMMPISAMIPKAIIATVILVLSLLPLTVRQANINESCKVIKSVYLCLKVAQIE